MQNFIQRKNLKDLRTIRVIANRIYGRSTKSFILIVSNGLGVDGTQALSISLEFYA
jgi:hypothetical protein